MIGGNAAMLEHRQTELDLIAFFQMIFEFSLMLSVDGGQ
jgi:hypothetical protein